MASPIQVAPVAEGTTSGTADELRVTFGSALTNGSRIAVHVSAQGTGGVATATGFGVSSWTADKVTTTTHSVTIFSGITDGSSATGGVNTAYGYYWISAIEMPSTVSIDTTANANGQSNAFSTGSATPTASADILMFGAVQAGELSTTGPTNSFTAITGTGAKAASMYRNVASASGSYSSGMGNANNYTNWTGVIAVYKVTGGGGGSTVSGGYYHQRRRREFA